jgi:hypothetical protein
MEIDVQKFRDDPTLRPYVFDFLCKGFLLGLTDQFSVPEIHRVKFQKQYYESLHELSQLIGTKSSSTDVLYIIEQVSTYYLAKIGRIGFETYNPVNK